MKIAIISEGRHPVFGGGQVHVQFLCEGLVKQYGAQVDLFTRKLKDENGKKYDKDESLLGGRWKIIRTGWTTVFFNGFSRLYRIISFSLYLIRKAGKEKYDIIHAHALMPGLPAKLAGRINNIPVVYTVHGTMHLDVPKKDKYYYLEKFFVTRLRYDLEISVSHQIFKYTNRNKNIQIICNGVDIKAYDAVKVSQKYKGLNLITVARIDRQKNHLMLLEAINQLDRDLLDKVGFCWNIVGDGPLREKVESYIEEHDLGKYVKLKGKIFGDNLIAEYKKHQAFILPSLGEGQPLTILEAYAAKLPVIATDVGDNEFFVKPDYGRLVQPGSVAVLKKALEELISLPPDDIKSMGLRAYSFVQEYDWSKVVDRTYAEYEKIVSSIH